ncbi:molybdopterin-containing oxidoreductase family protein [Pseudonocardia sp. GCM10023141]|uniref:molybdopterin-containing oxidoreductase family protein n=1 Tax=Pseudonocardia sp. GCM10023141 TaxID=3252653 RepID=UPI0036198A14
MTTTHISYCRLCPALCGMLVDVADDKVVRVRADTANTSSAGYSCVKGRNAPSAHNHQDRILRHLRKRADGEFETISLQAAVDDIGERLTAILAESGPESIGSYWGTYAWRATATLPIAKAWWEAIGSHKTFSPITIDQASKTVTYGRTGAYVGGVHRLEDADVWMEVGGNQLVSLQSLGWSNTNPTVNLRDQRKRGLKLIVVDPRRTELARSADIHLQVRPGTDAVLLSAFLNVIFAEELDRPQFWGRYARNVEALRRYVRDTTPAVAAEICGVPEEDLHAAARMFGSGRCGMANGHTGTDMGPGGNPCEHLLNAINIVCGRFADEGDEIRAATLTGQAAEPRARVIGPYRKWESGWQSRLGYGLLPSPHSHFGELPATLLAEEVLAPGPDRVRALFSIGGNPVNAIPDTRRQVEAMKALDLLVTIDPFMTETARLADYVISPTMMYERADFNILNGAFGQYSPPVVPAPGDTVDEWEFFWRLGGAQRLDMRLGEGPSEGVGAFAAIPRGRPGALSGEPPSIDAVLEMIADDDQLLELLKEHPRGYAAPPRTVTVLGPLDTDQDHLDLFPPEFPEEMGELRRVLEDSARRRYRLVVRRSKETFNGTGKNIPELNKGGTNPLYVNPDDLAELGLVSGDRVVATSDHGTVRAVTRADDSLRPGVVAMTHGWGGLEDEDPFAPGVGANVNNLISTRGPAQQVLRMPIMSALPVDIVPLKE